MNLDLHSADDRRPGARLGQIATQKLIRPLRILGSGPHPALWIQIQGVIVPFSGQNHGFQGRSSPELIFRGRDLLRSPVGSCPSGPGLAAGDIGVLTVSGIPTRVGSMTSGSRAGPRASPGSRAEAGPGVPKCIPRWTAHTVSRSRGRGAQASPSRGGPLTPHRASPGPSPSVRDGRCSSVYCSFDAVFKLRSGFVPASFRAPGIVAELALFP